MTWHKCTREQGKTSQRVVLSFSRPFNTHAYLCKLLFPFGWMMNCHGQSEQLLEMSSVQNYRGLHWSLSLLESSQNNADISLKEVTTGCTIAAAFFFNFFLLLLFWCCNLFGSNRTLLLQIKNKKAKQKPTHMSQTPVELKLQITSICRIWLRDNSRIMKVHKPGL